MFNKDGLHPNRRGCDLLKARIELHVFRFDNKPLAPVKVRAVVDTHDATSSTREDMKVSTAVDVDAKLVNSSEANMSSSNSTLIAQPRFIYSDLSMVPKLENLTEFPYLPGCSKSVACVVTGTTGYAEAAKKTPASVALRSRNPRAISVDIKFNDDGKYGRTRSCE